MSNRAGSIQTCLADIYGTFQSMTTAVITMVAVTTVVSPIWLKKSYQKQIMSEDKPV
ncbi:MAG: hypothetical protein M3247_08435 [Thermoproteota archaeon]|nr:hypothetical protein [Thermoproteota archaeon]